MLKQPLISVIVPIYNVEKYLCKCIDSIINQTLKDIEIILVNDGSTDNCGKIIDEYAKKDKRIVAIHKENGGQSSARNMGLDTAKGKYIGFVDSDDWIELDMYENMYRNIDKSKSDVIVCGRQSYLDNGDIQNIISLENKIIDLNYQSIEDYISNKLFYKHTVVVWNKLYSKSIIEDKHIRFENVSYVGSEDALFNYQFLMNAKKIESIDRIFYNQLSRDGSTARTYKAGYMYRTSNLIKCMNRYTINNDKKINTDNIISLFLLFFFQWNLSQIRLFSTQNEFQLIRNELEEAANNIEFMKYIKVIVFNKNINKYMKNMGFRTKGIMLIKLEMMLYYFKLYSVVSRVIIAI